MNEQAEQALALAGFPGPLLDAIGNALAYIDHIKGIRDEQAAKLRRHLEQLRAATLHIEDLEAKNARLEDAEAERDEVVSLLGEIREFARMKSDGPAVCDDLWEVKEMADTFIMRNAPQPGAVIVEGVAQEGGAA